MTEKRCGNDNKLIEHDELADPDEEEDLDEGSDHPIHETFVKNKKIRLVLR